jgi:hypothetical protein
LQLVAMDFTHAFTCGGDITRRLGFIDRVRDPKIYGLFPEFQNFLDREHVSQFAIRLGQFSRNIAEEIVDAVPHDWEVDRQNRTIWATMITDRAHFVAEHIDAILWPQLKLEGGTE